MANARRLAICRAARRYPPPSDRFQWPPAGHAKYRSGLPSWKEASHRAGRLGRSRLSLPAYRAVGHVVRGEGRSVLVFVAGGSGVIGRPLVSRLAQAGHNVVATTRSAERVQLIRDAGAEPVVVDAFDADAFRRAIV